ncbi:MAG: MOSC domain-containing protein [Cyanobacteria bacterium]|nr:MOSC domain-containing protein [Cyanobacteriota bacterium]
MNVLSVHLSLKPETLTYQGQQMESGIAKKPVDTPVYVDEEGLQGDTIVDRRFHGGRYKAVYSYAIEDYQAWGHMLAQDSKAKPGKPLSPFPTGGFGENLTTQGLDASMVCIGDQFQIGKDLILQVTEPRHPCRTLGMHFQDMGIIRQFLKEGRFGIYYQVIQPGFVQAGDPILKLEDTIQSAHKNAGKKVFLDELSRLYFYDKDDVEGLENILSTPALPPQWRERFEEQLAQCSG